MLEFLKGGSQKVHGGVDHVCPHDSREFSHCSETHFWNSLGVPGGGGALSIARGLGTTDSL